MQLGVQQFFAKPSLWRFLHNTSVLTVVVYSRITFIVVCFCNENFHKWFLYL